MRIVDIREVAVPVRSTMRNAAFDFSEMTTSVVAVITDVVRGGKPVAGFAFNSTGRYACGAAMRDRFIPRILSARPDDLFGTDGLIDPDKVFRRMMLREKPGGDAERSIPIGTIETAVWDALAKVMDQPLWAVLAAKFNDGIMPTAVPCYVGGGWYREGDIVGPLQDEIRGHLDQGYRQIKIKVGGASIPEDIRRIEGALKVLGDGRLLAVDANAALSLDRALAYAEALAPFGLRWFEEPCAPVAYDEFAEIADIYDAPLATGENLYCLHDVTNLLKFGGFRTDRDILQIDPPQAYGIGNFVRTMRQVEAMGGSRSRILPHGGNMMSFQVVAGLGLGGSEAYPGVFGQFGGYAEGMVLTDGHLNLPDCPGIGFERQPALYETMAALAF